MIYSPELLFTLCLLYTGFFSLAVLVTLIVKHKLTKGRIRRFISIFLIIVTCGFIPFGMLSLIFFIPTALFSSILVSYFIDKE